MNNILRNNSLRLSAILLAFSFQVVSQAQVLDNIKDYVTGQIKDYIYGEVNSILHTTNSYLGSFGSSIWEGVVDYKLESDLEESAQKFEEFEPKRLELNDLQNRYSAYARTTPYSNIHTEHTTNIHGLIHAKKDVPIKVLGNGVVKQAIDRSNQETEEQMQITALDDVLLPNVMDSIRHYAASEAVLPQTLLEDMRKNYRMAVFLNQHPTAVRVYCNSLRTSILRSNIAHLLYWSETADAHHSMLSRKAILINPRNIKFEDGGIGVNIMYNGQRLGFMQGNEITCESIELLNLQAMPKTRYLYGNFVYRTDAMGRVESVIQKLAKSYKAKCPQKSKVKKNDFAAVHGTKDVCLSLAIAPLEFGAPEVLQNSFFYEKSDANKIALKALKKGYKTILKSENVETIETTLEYSDYGIIPSKISFDGFVIPQKKKSKNTASNGSRISFVTTSIPSSTGQ